MSINIQIQHSLSPRLRLDVQIESPTPLLGLTGPSGSGKTSILHVIAGLVHPDHSRIVINGQSLDGQTPAQRRLGLAMQTPHLFPHLNTRQNLVFGAREGHGNPSLDEITEWLEISDLLDRSPRHLSGGERSRVALGRAILSNPRALLLDEPFAAVDDDRKRRIASHLKHYLRTNAVGMIIVSHDARLLETLADQIVPIVCGKSAQSQSSMPLQSE